MRNPPSVYAHRNNLEPQRRLGKRSGHKLIDHPERSAADTLKGIALRMLPAMADMRRLI